MPTHSRQARSGLALLSALALLCGTVAAQFIGSPLSTRHYDFDISSVNGTPLHGEARGVDGLDFQPSVSVTVSGDRATLHRLFLDRTHRIFFGYDLLVVPEPGTARLHLHFSRLTSLSSFQGVHVEDYKAGEHVIPFSEKTLSLGEPLVLPMEVDRGGATVLQDRLVFGVGSR